MLRSSMGRQEERREPVRFEVREEEEEDVSREEHGV
jgi:hypothetical protein